MREKHRLRVFENRVLRRIFRPKRDEVTWDWRRLRSEALYGLTHHEVLFGSSNKEERDWRDMLHYRDRLWWENLREEYLENLGT